MLVDRDGFRLNVGIVLANRKGHIFWGRRVGHDTWQFPQGGVNPGEEVEEALYRELHEEVGLQPEDVKLLGSTKSWLKYHLPKQYIRQNSKPLVVGQKQKWFILRLQSSDQKIRLNLNPTPEFDSWRWVDYWYPPKHVIYFKQKIYQRALRELHGYLSKPDFKKRPKEQKEA